MCWSRLRASALAASRESSGRLAAVLLIGGYFLFAYVHVGHLKPWELAGWIAIGIAGLFFSGRDQSCCSPACGRAGSRWDSAALFAVSTGWIRRAPSRRAACRRCAACAPWSSSSPGGCCCCSSCRCWSTSATRAWPASARSAAGSRCPCAACWSCLLVLALAEPRLRRPNENVCVLYVVDRSMSVPQEIDSGSAEGERDHALAATAAIHPHERAATRVRPSQRPFRRDPVRPPAAAGSPAQPGGQADRHRRARRRDGPELHGHRRRDQAGDGLVPRRTPASASSCSRTATRTSATRKSRPIWPSRTACRSTSFLLAKDIGTRMKC